MSSAGFPEPLTFSLRAWSWLRRHRERFDIVHDKPSGEPETLAGAIARLLDDPGLRRRLGANARARIKGRFTWDRTAHRTLERYMHVLGRGRC